MAKRADGVRATHSLFQEKGSGATPTSALQLWLDPIDIAEAKQLNALWHSRLPRFGTGAVAKQPGFPCYGACFEGVFYAVAIWSNPCARLLPQQTWLELRRLAIAPDAPKNTASRMLAVMTRILNRARPHVVRLVSYQDTEAHTGGIYKAAGWKPSTLSDGGNWTRPKCGRNRPKAQSEAAKQCWDKCLVCAMGPTRNQMCEVCRERFPEADADTIRQAGAEANLSLPERKQVRTDQREIALHSPLGNAPS